MVITSRGVRWGKIDGSGFPRSSGGGGNVNGAPLFPFFFFFYQFLIIPGNFGIRVSTHRRFQKKKKKKNEEKGKKMGDFFSFLCAFAPRAEVKIDGGCVIFSVAHTSNHQY